MIATHETATVRVAQILEEERRRRLAPPPRLTVSEWADRFRVLSREASAEPGQWRTARAPYLQGIMDAFSDPRVEEVVVMSSAQVGKTECILNVAGYFMHQDPAPILVVLPNIEEAEGWSKIRLAPMIDDAPALKERVREPTSRASGNTLRVKEFPGGHITLVGSNAPSGLAAKPIRVVLGDEVDRWADSAGTEGSPRRLATKRTSTFWNRKLGWFSTPKLKGPVDQGGSPIEAAFLEGDQRRYYVPCPHCGQPQVLRWGNLKFDATSDQAAEHTAEYACEGCGSLWEEADKPAILSRGEWRSHAPAGRVASFHLNALYSPWARWGELAREFVKAQGNVLDLQVFVNTVLGESWEDRGSLTAAEGLAGRQEAYHAPIPDQVQAVTVGVDVQADRLEAVVRGWGHGEEAWFLERAIFLGDSTVAETSPGSVWEQLETLRVRYWNARPGRCAMAIDSGYNPEAVYRYAKPRYGAKVFVTRGASKPGQPILTRKPSVNNKARARVFYVGTDAAKDSIYGRLKVSVPGPMYWHYPVGTAPEYFEQLTSEKRVRKQHAGRWVSRYEVLPNRRNEGLDCEVGNLVALLLLNAKFEAVPVAATAPPLAAVAPMLTPVEPPAPPVEPKRGRQVLNLRPRGGGFVNRW